jgi:hypothetical protein
MRRHTTAPSGWMSDGFFPRSPPHLSPESSGSSPQASRSFVGPGPRFEPRETHAFRIRRLTVDVWRSYARSRSNVAVSHTSAGTLGARRVECGPGATCQAKRQWSLAGGRVATCTDVRRTMSCLLDRLDWYACCKYKQYIGFLDV